jgi:lysozyme
MDINKAKAAIDKHLRKEEGERLEPYLCEAKVPTIGVGATTYPDGRRVKLSDPPITRAQMNEMLALEIDRSIGLVLEMTEAQCTTNQLIALVICGYNIGFPGLRGSSIIKAHKAKNYAAAARAFRLWNKYRPKGPGTPLEVHPVLDQRRAREAAIYSTPDDDTVAAAPPAIPQKVEPESKPSAGPIAVGGIATIGAGVVNGLREVGESVGSVKVPMDAAKSLLVDTLGIPAEWILPGFLILVGAVVWHVRLKQRKEGWA